MPVGVHGDFDARMPQLLGHVLDGGMKLIGLDGRIAVPQIVDTIDAQSHQGTDVPMDRMQPCWCPRSTTGAAKNHSGDGRHPLQDDRIKTPVPEIQERCTEFLGHVHTAALAVLWGVKQAVNRISSVAGVTPSLPRIIGAALSHHHDLGPRGSSVAGKQ